MWAFLHAAREVREHERTIVEDGLDAKGGHCQPLLAAPLLGSLELTEGQSHHFL